MIITSIEEYCPRCGNKVIWFRDYDKDGEFYQCSHCQFVLRTNPNDLTQYGRLMSYIKALFPVHVGNTVYKICSGDFESNYEPYVKECVVNEISWKQDYKGRDLDFAIIADTTRMKFTSMGTTWFQTREEAEEYLRKKGKKHD